MSESTRKKVFKYSKNTLIIILGNFLAAFGYVAFIFPCNLVSGGATGIGLMLFHLTGVRVSTFVYGLNVILFFFGLFLLGKDFAMGTLLSSFIYPTFMRILEYWPQLQTLTTDPMLSSIFGGLVVGLGIGIVFKVGASTGGTDPIPLVLHKYLRLPMTVSMYVTDVSIILMQVFFSNSESVLYGIVFVFVESFVVDRISTIGESKVQILTISERSSEIRDAILNKCNMGSTMLQIETGYKHEQEQAVMTVVYRRYVPQIEKVVMSIDPKAFMQTTNIAAVHGKGFTIERES